MSGGSPLLTWLKDPDDDRSMNAQASGTVGNDQGDRWR